MLWENYYTPDSLEEAIELLRKDNGNARIIAGGTDYFLNIKTQTNRPKAIVDISRVRDFGNIVEEKNSIHIGASVTHMQAVESEAVNRYAAALAEAAHSVGSPQIRNMGTIVGNVVNAQPAADTAVALVALDARIHSTGKHDGHTVEDLYRALGTSTINSAEEIVTGVYFQKVDNNNFEGCGFERAALRKALSLPVINVAVYLKLNREKGQVETARIVVAPLGFKPSRVPAAEEYLISKNYSDEVIDMASQITMENTTPRTSSLRGSAEYRKPLIKTLTIRCLAKSFQRASDSSSCC